MPPANPHGTALNHLNSSNSTIQHFLGAEQRGWMTPHFTAHPVATSSITTSAPNGHMRDATNAPLLVQPPPTQQPNEMQASNVRWAILDRPPPDLAWKRTFDAAFGQPATPIESTPGQRQQPPHPGSPPANPASAPLPSSPASAMENLPRLTALLDAQFGTRDRLDEMVSYRASILRDACLSRDIFYLCLHQIFCRVTADAWFSAQIGFCEEQIRGLDVMQALLLSNTRLPTDALQFFAKFPYSGPPRTSPMPAQVVDQVRAFLSGLNLAWETLTQACLGRGYPPYTDELRARLRLGSPVLQKILFYSIHCQLAGSDSPAWVQHGVKLFDEDQRESQGRYNGYLLSDQQIEIESLRLGDRYRSLRSTFQCGGLATASLPCIAPADVHLRGSQHANAPVASTAGFLQSPAAPSQNGAQFGGANSPRTPSVQQPSNQSHQQVSRVQQAPTQHQHAITNMRQHASQISANISNHVPQAQPRRRGRPPLSRNRQASRPTASPALLTTNTTSPGRNSASGRGARVTTTAPAAVAQTGRRSNKAGTLYHPFFPWLGQEPIQGINPNPRIVALHQAHLRSAKYKIMNGQAMTRPVKRLYQVPTGCALPPQALGQSCPFFSWQFKISADELQKKAKDLHVVMDPRNPALAEPVRQVNDGSLLYRLKCNQIPATAMSTSIPEDVWVTLETVWPSAIFLAINDNQLETRRKLHHGKDLAIDVTEYMKEGLNTLTCSLLRTADDLKAGTGYAVVIEIVEIISDERIKDLPGCLNEADAMESMTKNLKSYLGGNSDGGGADKDKDDEVELVVVDAHLSVDITDPYTARMFELPVRGKTCLHRECFDLRTFLDTRKAGVSEKDKGIVPTNPDEWKCPICKKDARPQNLVVDGFLKEVRKELEERGQLDVKAIRVQADGKWEPVLEPTNVGNRRDSTTTTTDDADGGANWRQSAVGAGVAEERWMGMGQGQGGQGENAVIELD